ncbi:MAG: aminotransferase class III-fold pyridoxal phosphate-dependent enzyme [Gammaproteobacteria bacterium]|nr:MAG: aminotransferase class III-fold pyridoxal phosphate-dependent enzyme [Gammaproteobacteria bacterium]
MTHLLLTKCGADFEPIVYSSSGSEAAESAMKVALQYWDARGQRAKRRFIARQRSYHATRSARCPYRASWSAGLPLREVSWMSSSSQRRVITARSMDCVEPR